jgi:hypothetical protein
MDVEQFKAVNTFQCSKLKADAITPEACVANRRKLPFNKGIPGIRPNPMPFACEECADWKSLCSEVYAKRRRAGIKAPHPRPSETPAVAEWVCAHCKTQCSPHPAVRGLGWKCYYSMRKHGGLENYPSKTKYPPKINYHRKNKDRKEDAGERPVSGIETFAAKTTEARILVAKIAKAIDEFLAAWPAG